MDLQAFGSRKSSEGRQGREDVRARKPGRPEDWEAGRLGDWEAGRLGSAFLVKASMATRNAQYWVCKRLDPSPVRHEWGRGSGPYSYC